jgi:cobalamin synthase
MPVVEAPAVVVEPTTPGARENSKKASESETALHSQGQRDTSLIWETTQQKLALSVMWTALGVALAVTLFGGWLGVTPELRLASAMFVYGIANLITGFYFGRTNHQRVGGPGGDSAGTR